MRVLAMMLAGAVGSAAQGTAPDAAAVKLKQFEQNLEKAMRLPGWPVAVTFPRAPGRVCAIPLLKVRPDPTFKSNMPTIAPDPKFDSSIRVVTPPAPVCEGQAWK